MFFLRLDATWATRSNSQIHSLRFHSMPERSLCILLSVLRETQTEARVWSRCLSVCVCVCGCSFAFALKCGPSMDSVLCLLCLRLFYDLLVWRDDNQYKRHKTQVPWRMPHNYCVIACQTEAALLLPVYIRYIFIDIITFTRWLGCSYHLFDGTHNADALEEMVVKFYSNAFSCRHRLHMYFFFIAF